MDPTPSALLEQALAADPGRPLLTFYDDATGERVELSVATTANWVAKTAGLLVDGLGAAPGDRVSLQLPRHWLAAVWALAAWRTGCQVLVGRPEDGPDGPAGPAGPDGPVAVAVAGPDGLAGGRTPADETVGVSLLPLGAPFRPGTLPADVLDFAVEVPGHPDRFGGPVPSPDSAALRAAGGAWTLREAVDLAAATARRWDIGPGGRLLVADPLHQPDELLAATLVPLVVGGSAVLVRNPDARDLDGRAVAERVTARATQV